MSKATELRELASLTTISSGQIEFATDIKISGDLITTGNTITITADTLNISDPNITLASGAANSSVADGAGITIDGANATLTWDAGAGRFAFNKHLRIGTTDLGGQTTVVSQSDAPLIVQSTDAYTGLQFTDVNASSYLFYYGVANSFYFNSAKLGVGVASPGARLYVRGEGGGAGYTIQATDASSNETFYVQDGGRTGVRYYPFTVGIPSTTAVSNTIFQVEESAFLHVHDDGNVGIGVATPTAKLHLVNTNSVDIGIGIQNDTRYYGLEVVSGRLRVKDVSSGGTERFSVLANGNVGIGDITAKHKLDVDGAIATRQVRHSVAPSLVLDFANLKELDSRITFYRESVGSYYDSKGILRFARNNEPRFDHDPVTGESRGLLIEETRTNLLQYSDALTYENSYWQARGMTLETGMIAPDGTASAIRVTENGTNPNPGFVSLIDYSNGGTQTFSVWLKADTPKQVYISTTGGQRGPAVDVTTEWQRFECTQTFNSGSGPHVGGFSTIAPGSNTSFYVWAPQLEYSTFATSYIPSETKVTGRSTQATYYDEDGILRIAPEGTTRYGYEYVDGKLVYRGLIVESASTNLSKNINYFGFESGSGQVLTRFTTDLKAPDDTYTAAKVDVTNVNDVTWSDLYWSYGASLAGQTKTFSVWVYGTAGETVNLRLDGIGAGGTYKTITLTGKWQRESVTYSYPATYSQTATLRIGKRALGTPLGTANVFYVWGSQLEDGHKPTSYIYTTTSSATSVTRSADIVTSTSNTRQADKAYIDGKAFSDFYNEEEGSVFVNYRLGNKLSQMRVASFSKNSSEYLDIVAGYGAVPSVTKGPYFFGPTLGDNVDASGSQLNNVANTDIKFAGRIQFNNYTATSSSILETSTGFDYNAGVANVNKLTFGDWALNDAQMLCGHIKKLMYYPVALSDNELLALAENN